MVNIKAKIGLKSSVMIWNMNFYCPKTIAHLTILLQKYKLKTSLLKSLILRNQRKKKQNQSYLILKQINLLNRPIIKI